MKPEEAISILERMLDEFCNEDTWMQECKDAVDMAIEALKEQPEHSQNTPQKQPDLETLGVKTGKTCADTISRQAAIDVIFADKIDDTSLEVMTALGDGRLALTLNSACDRHIRAIEQLPSAQPEIVRCKECMNHGKEICYFWSHFYGTINTPDDGFCHKVERRTDG